MPTVSLNFSSSGDNTVISYATALPGGLPLTGTQFIRIIAFEVTTQGSVNVLFYDGPSSGGATFRKRGYTFNANSGTAGVVLPTDGAGHFDLTIGNSLICNLSAGVGVYVNVTYAIVGQKAQS